MFTRKKKAAGIVFRRLIFAERENRTPDPTLFRRMLYQLSYLGSGDRPRFNACGMLPVSLLLAWAGWPIPWVTVHTDLVTYLATVPMALAGLMALLIRSFSEHEAYSESTRRYQRMFVVFDFAFRRLHKIHDRGYAGDLVAVIGELGHEALTEHADWLILHRERPLSFVHG